VVLPRFASCRVSPSSFRHYQSPLGHGPSLLYSTTQLHSTYPGPRLRLPRGARDFALGVRIRFVSLRYRLPSKGPVGAGKGFIPWINSWQVHECDIGRIPNRRNARVRLDVCPLYPCYALTSYRYPISAGFSEGQERPEQDECISALKKSVDNVHTF
jgi:hypothetical protein